jgi:molybdopterin/thiamine biosynthesis adenylyltransferase
VLDEIYDFDVRERAGALFVVRQAGANVAILVGLEWMPVPDEYVQASIHGLSFDGRFGLRVAERAAELKAGALLVHAHPGSAAPVPSTTDAERGAAFMAFMQRRLPEHISGLLIVADHTLTGIVGTPTGTSEIKRVVAAGIPMREWTNVPSGLRRDGQVDRQLLAIGAEAQERLGKATIAVIGNSGGGSHVTQQLIHAGAGTVVVVDPDVVEETNLRRLVGAVQADIGTTPKPDVAVRIAKAARPTTAVVPIREAFPSTATIDALRHVDIIVGCVDGWDTREDLNTFALRHRIPYIDIGIAVAGPTDRGGMRVGGQIAIVAPDGPCLRCMGLVTDERVEASRARRQGYTDQEPDPQVVSLNGTVASEAVTTALMLLAGDDRLVRRRRYAYPPGLLIDVASARSDRCSACQEAVLRVAAEVTFAPQPAEIKKPSLRRRFHRRVGQPPSALKPVVRASPEQVTPMDCDGGKTSLHCLCQRLIRRMLW